MVDGESAKEASRCEAGAASEPNNPVKPWFSIRCQQP